MFEKTKKEVQDHINIGRAKRDDDMESIQEDKQSSKNSSYMGKQNNKGAGKIAGFIDEFEDEIFVTYHRFFIQPKHAIIDKWKKEISEYKRIKIDKRKQKGMHIWLYF